MRARALESTPEGSLWRQIWCASGPDGHESPVPWMTARVGRGARAQVLESTLRPLVLFTPVLQVPPTHVRLCDKTGECDASTGALESTLEGHLMSVSTLRFISIYASPRPQGQDRR
jgi:hypothetical protein